MPVLVEDPREVREFDYPRSGSASEKLLFLLNYAVLAPSSHNSQPWLFKIIGDEVELYADRTRALPVVDPDDRELIISCGAALLHLTLAIRHYGREAVVHTFPDLDDPDLLAFVRTGTEREPSLMDHRLFSAIKQRHTNRQPFEPRPVPDTDLTALEKTVREAGVQATVLRDAKDRQALGDLIAEGDRAQAHDKRFRRELASWLHPNRSHNRDGIPGYAQGVSDILSYAGPLVVRTFDWGEGQAAHDQQLAEGSPALAVLSTDIDNPAAWLSTGQGLARMLLRAEDLGLSASFLNQPVEVPSLRASVAELTGGPDYPQLILRIGYGRKPTRPTPRRPVRNTLVSSPYL